MEELGRRKGDLQDMQPDGIKVALDSNTRDPGTRFDRLPERFLDNDSRYRRYEPCI